MQSALCFSTLLPLQPQTASRVWTKKAPLCILGQSPSVAASPAKPKRTNVPKKLDSTPTSFRVLPDIIPKQDRPKPPPEHWGLPFFGFILEHWLGVEPGERAKKYDGIYHSSFLLDAMHFVTDMTAIHEIHRDPDVFTSVGSLDAFEAIFGANSMILLDGLDHALLRNTVAPAFSPTLFPFYFDMIRNRVKRTWAAVESDVNSNKTVKLDPVFRKHYLAITVEMTTGIDMDSEMASFLYDQFFCISNSFFSPQFGPYWEKGQAARDKITIVLEDLIKQNLIEKKDTIDKLREYGDNLSYKGSRDIKKGDVNVLLISMAKSSLKTGADVENDATVINNLAQQMLLLWFAGFATSAATSSCAAFEMGRNSDIWNALVEEQDALMREAGDSEITFEQANTKMPLLDSFITEMLRTHPAAGGAIRVATKDVEILGKLVKAGEKVFLDYQAAMRNSDVYPDPYVVKVDRFLHKEGQPKAPKVIAFGAPGSPHYCIGAALAKIFMKSTLSVLLREYVLELDPTQSQKYAVIPDDTPRSKVVVQKLTRRH